MKKFLIVLLAITCQISFSQTKKKSVPSTPKKVAVPPPIVRAPPLPKEAPKPINRIGLIMKETDGSLTFKHEVEKDTIILPNGEFAELIILSNYSEYLDDFDVLIRTNTAVDTLKISASENKETKLAHSYYQKMVSFDATAKNNIITAIERETKQPMVFKAVLNKEKKKILYLESVPGKKRYLPSEPYYPPPMMGN